MAQAQTTEEQVETEAYEGDQCGGIDDRIAPAAKSTNNIDPFCEDHCQLENEDIKQLVTKYYLYKKNQGIREKTSLKQVSPNGPPYHSVDSFAFIPDNIPIVLIMGEMGTGKSSLCNKMAGIYYKIVEKKIVVSKSENKEKSDENDKEKENDSDEEVSYMPSDDEEENVKIEYEIIAEGQNELFKSGHKEKSETQNTSWANVEFLGDKEQRLIILDTPGLNDHEKLAQHHREDLKSKLAAIHRIDAILIVFDKAGRFKKAHGEMLDDIASLFATNENFYDHFGIAVTHCDESDTQWPIGHKKRLTNFQNVISNHFFGKNEECKEDNNSKRKIPIFTFSNIQDSKRFGKEGIRRWSHYKEFEKFYKFCMKCHENTLVTGDYYLMQKMDNAIEKLEKEFYMTSTSALHYLIEQMVAERRRLDDIDKKNARYLQRRPKNAMEGFEVFIKSIVATVRQFTVFGDDDDNEDIDESKYHSDDDDDNGTTTTTGQSSGGGWTSWFTAAASNTVNAVTKRVSKGIGLGATGVAGLIDGVSASVKQENRNEIIKQQQKEYEKMRKSLIAHVLDGNKVKVKEMSLRDENRWTWQGRDFVILFCFVFLILSCFSIKLMSDD